MITDETEKIFIIRELDNQLNAAMLQFEAKTVHLVDLIYRQHIKILIQTLSPQEQSSLLLTYQIDIFTDLKGHQKLIRLVIGSVLWSLKKIDKKESLRLNYEKALIVLMHSRFGFIKNELVVGAKLSNKVNKELFELNKTSINDLFRS